MNTESKTPRTDAAKFFEPEYEGYLVCEDFARTLELELAEANRKLGVAKEALEMAQRKYRGLYCKNVDELHTMETPYDQALATINSTTKDQTP